MLWAGVAPVGHELVGEVPRIRARLDLVVQDLVVVVSASGRSGALPDDGGKIIAREFDHRKVGGVVRVQPPPTSPGSMTAKCSGEAKMSDFIMSGSWKGSTPPPLPAQ